MADADDVSDRTGVSIAAPRDPLDGRQPSGLLDETVGRPIPHPTSPQFATLDDCDEIEALRRDVARLEGKLDALLAALDVEVGDGDE